MIECRKWDFELISLPCFLLKPIRRVERCTERQWCIQYNKDIWSKSSDHLKWYGSESWPTLVKHWWWTERRQSKSFAMPEKDSSGELQQILQRINYFLLNVLFNSVFDRYVFSLDDWYLPTVHKANNQIDKFEVSLRCETAGKKDSRLCILQPAIQVVWRTPRRSRTIFLSISSLMFRSIKL